MKPLAPHRPLGYATPFGDALDPGERVVWSGQPRQGVYLQASDLGTIPFSLFWCGFVAVWETVALRTVIHPGPGPTPWVAYVFPLWGIPFVLVGLHLLVGRFFVDAWRRRRTWYAVTGSRALIQAGGLTPRTTSIDLRTTSQVDLIHNRDGTGTVTFGTGPSEAVVGLTGRRGRLTVGNAFDHVADAGVAYRAVRAAQQGGAAAGGG